MKVEQLGLDIPGCQYVTHLNNAGAALMPRPILDAATGYLRSEAFYGGYETNRQYEEELDEFYEAAATFIGAKAEEIAFMENATRAWASVFYALPFQPGDRILTSRTEYASNYMAYLQRAEKEDLSVELIPEDNDGVVSISQLAGMMDERVRFVGISHMPTNSGQIQPVEKIGRLLGDYNNCWYLVDACQSVGQYPVDVEEIGCDFLSATGRKFLRGPRGTGFLYVNSEILEEIEPPVVDVRSATWRKADRYDFQPGAKRFELWEQNFAGKIGLTEAIKYANAIGIRVIWERIQELSDYFRNLVSDMDGIELQDIGRDLSGIVSLTVRGKAPEQVRKELEKRNVNISTTGVTGTRLDMEQRGLDEVCRVSIHYYNTRDELDLCAEMLAKMVK